MNEIFMNLAPSSLQIYKILQTRKQMTFKEITSQTKYSTRTVRYALRDLSDAGIIGKIPDMTDLRRCFYSINR